MGARAIKSPLEGGQGGVQNVNPNQTRSLYLNNFLKHYPVNDKTMSRILFSEQQKFSQVWLIAIMVATNLIVVGTLGWGLYKQLVTGEPWGDRPLSDMGLTILFLSMLLVMAMVNIIVFSAKLEVEIKNNSVYYKYFPFVWTWKYIHKDNISDYEVKQINAIKECGGYGYRKNFFKKTTGLIIKGKHGLLLTLHDGSKWIFGTQQPEALKRAMRQIINQDIDH